MRQQWAVLVLLGVFAVVVVSKGGVEQVRRYISIDKTWINSIGIEFVLVPAGTFQMGCSSATENCEDDEKPQHQVTISRPFYLGKYEVTQEQWQAVMGTTPSQFQGAKRPVERVSWYDVQEFIKKLNAKEGHSRYRLPTEAEWEYAARAGTTTAYSFGNDARQLQHYAWFVENCEGKTYRIGGVKTLKICETSPVGQKRPNAWGLYDMHGNVDEWVQDGESPYPAGSVVDPLGASAGLSRARRGGNRDYPAKHCRVSARGYWLADAHDGPSIGFRLALSVE